MNNKKKSKSCVQDSNPCIIICMIQTLFFYFRCDGGSGCCKPGQICKVAKEEILNATFYIKLNKQYKQQFFEIKNHTLCACQSIENTPK